MVAPITGPFTRTINDNSYYSFQKGYKQAKPHNLVLSYERRSCARRVITGQSPYGATTSAASIADLVLTFGSDDNALLSSAYETLRGRISDRASLGVSLMELDQSATMLRTRLTQLFQFGRQLSRGNLVGAASVLKLSTVPKRASSKKSFANNYLEFQLGWMPLIGDIHSTIDVLQSPVRNSYVRASAVKPMSDKLFLTSEVRNAESWYYRWYNLKRRCVLGTTVEVSNPNLWLANQLGLVNPAVFVYERIPFSFVANWFVNVEQFLSTGTDYYGLTLDKAFTTYIWEGDYAERDYYYGSYGQYHRSVDISAHFKGMVRSAGISKPALFVRPFKVWGWRRAATAASLIIQQLVKK